MAGDQIKLDLGRLNIGKNDLSVDALKAALEQVELGFSNKQVSVRSIRTGIRVHDVQRQCHCCRLEMCINCISLSGTEPVYVTHLNLRQNGIRCRGMEEISRALRSMKHLRILDISGNKIGCVGWNALGDVLAAAKHLLELDLSGNHAHHADPAPVAAALSPGRSSPPLELMSGPVAGENIVLLVDAWCNTK
jgi:hypothetical protein